VISLLQDIQKSIIGIKSKKTPIFEAVEDKHKPVAKSKL
jgi:hypothetical protein